MMMHSLLEQVDAQRVVEIHLGFITAKHEKNYFTIIPYDDHVLNTFSLFRWE